jgi:hypothetical protein
MPGIHTLEKNIRLARNDYKLYGITQEWPVHSSSPQYSDASYLKEHQLKRYYLLPAVFPFWGHSWISRLVPPVISSRSSYLHRAIVARYARMLYPRQCKTLPIFHPDFAKQRIALILPQGFPAAPVVRPGRKLVIVPERLIRSDAKQFQPSIFITGHGV